MKNLNTKTRTKYILSTLIVLSSLQTAWAVTPTAAPATPATVNAPKITKSLNPDSIKANDFVTLTLVISNPAPDAAKLTAPFVENLPAGMVILGLGKTNCGGTLTAQPNSTKIILMNAKIPARGSCQILVGVSGTKGGTYEIKTAPGALQTDKGANLVGSSITLTVVKPEVVDLRIKKTFNPTMIEPNQFTTLSIALTNPNSDVANLSTPFSDYLPSGMVIVGSAKTTCEGNLIAHPGTGRIVLQEAKIPAYGSCTILLGVTIGAEDLKRFQSEPSQDEVSKSSEQFTANK